MEDVRRHPRDQRHGRRVPARQRADQNPKIARIEAQRNRRRRDLCGDLGCQLVAEHGRVDGQRDRTAEAAGRDHQAGRDRYQLRRRGQLRHHDECIQRRAQSNAEERSIAEDIAPSSRRGQRRHQRTE